ncbi:non-ribosomal peptide synthetase/type I polyketide synthase [Chelativorans salis]|uniref:Amino acid adenylation domain-containing protein n=1 Tax=Chelativorans salis TaxID=2978478 RepID=A0ABT2LLW9_9HYPH|nr:non-ribosomal peptide synthetase/type I polyketide synthase [Chelativorans sp. EGI FJ00035]MCT7375570.1 amino acid adenylation domain-containing protein [Chelativorans sp. EGI FJ00035]
MNDTSPQAEALADEGIGSVAIIGMSGRFPGAHSVDALWDLIAQGRHAFAHFPPEEIEDAFGEDVRAAKDYVPARPHLDDVELFDAEFFGMYPREAALLDPQFRIFMEICWESIEGAGYDPYACPGQVGVFAGSALATYLINNVLSDREKAEAFTSNYQIGMFSELIGSINDTLATRVAYKLNLRGPAFTIQSACSTSLLAVAQACQNLLTYSCDMALAGGVSITFPQKRGYIYQEGGMASPDGFCRPFDADAAGTVFGSGAGVVLLKRLDDALRDGDHIHAVIRGYGVNNDGSGKVGYTAPSVEGQAEAITTAYASAGVDPATIGYVECHGTATPLGDPIEFAGLRKAFGDVSQRSTCALGSVKGNFGHLDAAAGVAGLIKAALVLRNAKIPPMANFSEPNPHIDLDDSPFYIPRALCEWPADAPRRRAGVSSFGVGGTNVHLVLEAAPPAPSLVEEYKKANHIIPLSALNEVSLAGMRRNLAEALRRRPDIPLPAVAFTLQNGRHHFAHRTAAIGANVEEAVAGLENERPLAGKAEETPPPVIFMFPGQGAQYVGMGGALYDSEPEFARWIDHGAGLLEAKTGIDLRQFIRHAGDPTEEMSAALRDTKFAQPALYLIEYATARLWMSRGLVPAAMIGHSVGEFVAATLANVMSFDDGLLLVANRGRLMQKQPKGAMVSVRAGAETVRAHLDEGVEIAAVNAPKLCVISGTFEAVDAACARLQEADIAFSRLHTSHAFHSAMMDKAAAALRKETGKLAYGTATIPYVSCTTGDWQTDALGTSPDYWAQHCRDAVRFAEGLATACREKRPVLLEVGPGRTLSVFAAQTINRGDLAAIVQSLPEHDRASAAATTFAEAHARLWISGCDLDWPQLPISAQRRLSLPTYAFQRQKHWIEAPRPSRQSVANPQTPIVVEASAPQASMPQPAHAYGTDTMNAVTQAPSENRIKRLETALLALLAEMSGEELAADAAEATFLELGFDSLFIGQFAQKLEKQYKVKLSFRELLSSIPTVDALARHLDAELPPDALQPAPGSAVQAPVPATQAPMVPTATPSTPAATGLEGLFQSQLQMMQQLFARQLQAAQTLGIATPPPIPQQTSPQSTVFGNAPAPEGAKPAEAENSSGRPRLYKPGMRLGDGELTPQKRAFIAELSERYSAKNAKSRAFTEANRHRLADPRAASGFRAEWKEIVFPVVSDRSKGSRIWDIDGNEYIDLVNGMGQTAFGHAPDFVVKAMIDQVNSGFAIGPQTPLAGEVAELIGEMTGHERVTFCNTGSEAVMAAMRVARTVTGREKVVVFGNDYHGQFDEVLVKGRGRSGAPAALPIAAGIPPTSLSNMTVLSYGAPESLEWIRANAEDIAAVIIEPVQSRHPELRPVEFVRELRRIATEGEFALVFDEVVTGFRVHPGGMQSVWGIKGDMATYGKVLGGGMPIGVLAGDSRFMDALDGGHWNYGDDSVPMVAPTFFAGTFVRHPVTLAAAKAVLQHIKGEGQALYSQVADRTQLLVEELNADLSRRGIAGKINGYASWFVTDFGSLDPLGALFYPHVRMQGIHVQDGYPCFLTTVHTEEDFQHIADVFRNSLDALQTAGILAPSEEKSLAAAPMPVAGETVSSAELTEAQKEIWLAAQAGDEASCSFNESFNLTLEGFLNKEAFRRALDLVIGRHDALHIRFSRSGERLEIIPDFRINMEFHDLAGDPDPEAALEELVAEEARTPFDLVTGPLARTRLVRLAANRHVLIFTAHHIVCDGWSTNVIVEELAAAYSAFVSNREPNLPPALSFAVYAGNLAKAETNPTTEDYWLKQFETVPELADLPTDRPRPERRTFAGGTCTRHIEKETYKRLKKAGAKSGATMFSTLLAALQVMIARLSDSTDIVIAVPSAGQSLLGDQTLVGHCVNLLPLRQGVDTGASFEKHLRATQQGVLQAFEHQDYTYGTLVRKLGIRRDPSRLPLTEIQFNLERMSRNAGFEGLSAKITPNPKAFSNFDMFLNMIESEDGIRIDVDYNGDVFDRTTIERWLGHFNTLVSAIADDIGRKVVDLPLLSHDQENWLVNEINQTATEYERDRFVFELFARKVSERPDAIAAEHDGASITYGALETRSNQLARHIQARLFIPGQRVALALDRSIDMLVALLAIMKAGHAYVPLDPNHPEARLRQTMEAADISALVCGNDTIARLAAKNTCVIRMDTERTKIDAQDAAPLELQLADAGSAAYIIFTSGSTGTPKGVEVSHRSLVNFLTSMARKPGFTPQDTLLAVTTISFDIAGLELYLPLIVGGKVVIADRAQVQDGFALVELLKACGATVLQATPTLWQILVEAGLSDQPSLKMLSGGEPLPKELARGLLKIGGELWNMYGPTETTIWSSLARVEDDDNQIHIGHPIANTQLYILDSNDRIAPVGVVGELCIGGDGLANGYFNRLDLTEAAFRPVRIGSKVPRRLYKTGDVGRRLADGTLQLLGRRDNQIKLRGFRIELGEIEAVIGKKDGIRQCAVVAAKNRNGDRQLVCHFVPADGREPSAEELTSHAKDHLPGHMVPSFWIATTELPHTANGKLNRKALERLGVPQREAAPIRTKPRTPMEERLSHIWKEVLEIAEIGVDENLYALGADSLSIFRIAARMMDAGLPLEAKHLLRHPTISELASYAEEQDEAPINGTAPHIPSLREFRNGARRGMERPS